MYYAQLPQRLKSRFFWQFFLYFTHGFGCLHSLTFFFWSAVVCLTRRQASAQKNYVRISEAVEKTTCIKISYFQNKTILGLDDYYRSASYILLSIPILRFLQDNKRHCLHICQYSISFHSSCLEAGTKAWNRQWSESSALNLIHSRLEHPATLTGSALWMTFLVCGFLAKPLIFLLNFFSITIV